MIRLTLMLTIVTNAALPVLADSPALQTQVIELPPQKLVFPNLLQIEPRGLWLGAIHANRFQISPFTQIRMTEIESHAPNQYETSA